MNDMKPHSERAKDDYYEPLKCKHCFFPPHCGNTSSVNGTLLHDCRCGLCPPIIAQPPALTRISDRAQELISELNNSDFPLLADDDSGRISQKLGEWLTQAFNIMAWEGAVASEFAVRNVMGGGCLAHSRPWKADECEDCSIALTRDNTKLQAIDAAHRASLAIKERKKCGLTCRCGGDDCPNTPKNRKIPEVKPFDEICPKPDDGMEDALDLAKEMHEEYERLSRQFGWKTQTPVPFNELPQANVKVMLGMGIFISKKLSAQAKRHGERVRALRMAVNQEAKPWPLSLTRDNFTYGGDWANYQEGATEMAKHILAVFDAIAKEGKGL